MPIELSVKLFNHNFKNELSTVNDSLEIFRIKPNKYYSKSNLQNVRFHSTNEIRNRYKID
ncbi:hypothetical protein FWJ33_04995 [Leptospira interrogans serovar Hardjo]|nr:hypothetical protein B0191_15735 [Leptospira interrogans serovar Hardjo]QEH98855.1 hypothetical protein FWJ33_04995 [Leptospira interrogans serovar Hardjo]